MRILALFALCFNPFFVNAQRMVSGKVIEEFELVAMPGVRIMTRDTLELAFTDLNGDFNIELPKEIDTLLLASVGMEWTLIKVPTDCNKLEIIMMSEFSYDFMSARSVNKRRFKRFKSLNRKQKLAFDKGIFSYATSCITYIFEK